MECESLLINATVASVGERGGIELAPGMFVAVKEGRIAAVEPMERLNAMRCERVIDLEGRMLSASLIDCHTHLVYGGERSLEFEMRLEGASYAQIAERGGGIASTIRATREAGEEELYRSARRRLEALLAEGVGSVEIKTGYGLELRSESRMLSVMERLEAELPVKIVKSFLGAHTLPPEFRGRADEYVEYLCEAMMPTLAPRLDAVDVYTEHLAFDLEQTRRIFEKARSLGLRVRIHAEQFSRMGATPLACSFGADSCDHLEYAGEEEAKAMAGSGTVAVLLPGAYYYLRERRAPPVELLRRHGVPMALATDLNPGTSPLASLSLMMNMGSVLFGLRVDEVFAAVTVNAARALGMEGRKGRVEAGYDADLVAWNVEHPRELVASLQPGAPHLRMHAGEPIDV